jgi:NADPH-dependent curcumin reductase CurA
MSVEASLSSTQVVVASFPVGMVKASDMQVVRAPVPPLADGQVLIETAYLSLDPAIRYWLNPTDTYVPGAKLGEPVRCFAAGRIAASRHADFKVGDMVSGLLNSQSHIVYDIAHFAKMGMGLTRCDLALGPLSQHLGVLGMPGMTAYFGLLERGQPVAGNTVFVSAASGTVGTTVGQIAKLKGCRVIGSAGGEAKCKWLVDEMGFDAAFDYKAESAAVALKRLAPSGVDIYFDNVGGDMLDGVLLNLARGARVVLCGALSQYNEGSYAGPKNYMKLITARGTMNGIIVFDFFPRWPRATAEIASWIKSGHVRPTEHIEIGIETFPSALVALFAGAHTGKQLVEVANVGAAA